MTEIPTEDRLDGDELLYPEISETPEPETDHGDQAEPGEPGQPEELLYGDLHRPEPDKENGD